MLSYYHSIKIETKISIYVLSFYSRSLLLEVLLLGLLVLKLSLVEICPPKGWT